MNVSGAETLPASWYVEGEIYQRERHGVFAREWLLFAHASALAEPGDYVADEIAGWPVFVIRGRGGALRGFHNVCRHRAGPLVWDGKGHCDVLRCRYHGWLYDTDGSLRRAPDFGDAEGFDTADYPLHPIRVEGAGELVFVCLDEAAPPLREALAGLWDELAALPLERLRFHGERVLEVRANWKAYIDNLVEIYHIPHLHPLLSREVDAKGFEYDLGERYCRQRAPAREGGVNAGTWFWRFPNLAINVYRGGMSLERAWPLGPGRFRLVLSYLFDEDAGEEAIAEALETSRVITDEDVAVTEAVQRNLEAGIYGQGRLSPKHEQVTYYFQDLVRQALA